METWTDTVSSVVQVKKQRQGGGGVRHLCEDPVGERGLRTEVDLGPLTHEEVGLRSTGGMPVHSSSVSRPRTVCEGVPVGVGEDRSVVEGSAG